MYKRQTLTNAERYTTDELKNLEDVILGAEDKLFSLEYELFLSLIHIFWRHHPRLWLP